MSKTFLTFSVCFILFLLLLNQANAGPTDPVSIPDAALLAFIRAKIPKPSGNITESDMSGMTGELTANYVSGTKISDLTGLEYATNINRLYLWKHSITNIGPLKGLTKLIQINLWKNNIVDITALKGLTKLTTLDLGDNEIVDLTPLKDLPVLNQLILQSNKITNVGPLKNLTSVTSLNLQKNSSLSAISPLRSLRKLVSLALSSTSVTASGLSTVLPYFSSLEILQLNFASVSNLSVLNKLPSTVRLGNLTVQSMTDSSLSLTHSGLLLKDISPLVTLMKAGKFKTGATVNVSYNWNLDYDSFYTHIPVLLAGGLTVGYKTKDPGTNMDKDPEPGLESVSEANTVGRARGRYTFVVRAYNGMHNYFYRLNSATVNYGPAYHRNTNFKGMPVHWTVRYPDGSTSATTVVKTGNDGLSRFAVKLGSHGEVYTLDAVVPAKQNTDGPSHGEFRVSFTVTADRDAPLPQGTPGLTVAFDDYPKEPPIEEFPITIKFSEPVTGFQKDDLIVETKLTTGTGIATLEELTPAQPIAGNTEVPTDDETLPPIQTYTARVGLPADATGTVRLIVRAEAALTELRLIGPVTNTRSEPIPFGEIVEETQEDIKARRPPPLVVTQIDFAKGMFWIQNTTQYRFYVEMHIYSEDHRDQWFKVSERDLIAIEDAETLTFSLTPVETDDASIKHLNSERLLSRNQNQPLKLSAEKFCIKLIRGVIIDTASNMKDDLRFTDTRWAPPGDVIFRQYDARWDEKLKGLRRDHLVYRRYPLVGKLADSWDLEASVPAAPSISRVQSEVVLSKFRSVPTDSGIIVEWTTASERTNAGFYVLRSRNRKSGFVRVSPGLLVGAGTTSEGNTYTWQDTTAEANVLYYYRLEGVSLGGERRALGTVRLRGFISSAGKVLWKWADVKTEVPRNK